MDMKFVYVLSGWESSAADSHVFECVQTFSFAIPEGWYYLADAGYSNCDALLVPYRGVQYYLKGWGQASDGYVLAIPSHMCSDPPLSNPKTTKNSLTSGTHSSRM